MSLMFSCLEVKPSRASGGETKAQNVLRLIVELADASRVAPLLTGKYDQTVWYLQVCITNTHGHDVR